MEDLEPPSVEGAEAKLEQGQEQETFDIQELVLSIHHATMMTLNSSPVAKIIENHEGRGVQFNAVQ